jgi:hypothetical protein
LVLAVMTNLTNADIVPLEQELLRRLLPGGYTPPVEAARASEAEAP